MKQPINIVVNTDTPQFVAFAAACNKLVEDHRAQNYPRLPKENIVPEFGTRYIRMSRVSENVDPVTKKPIVHSAWAFVDRTNGDVLKPATWRAPAKHARGNIFDDKGGMGSMGPYGPAYLR